MEYVIEKGVPVPPAGRPPSKLTAALRKMEVGDCLTLPPGKGPGVAATQMVEAQKWLGNGARFTRRKTPDGHRIWRIA